MTSFLDFLSNIVPLIITASFLVCTILLYVYVYVYVYVCKQAQISKKKYHPVGGTVFHMLINFKRLHHYMSDLAVKYKTFRMISPLHGEIYTADPVVVEYILKTNFENYGKGMYTYAWLSDFLGDGIFTVDGEKWREQRKLSSHEFSTKVVRDFSSVTFRKNAIKLGNIVLQAANNNQEVDINDLFMKATADSIFKFAFGIDLDNLSGSNEEGLRFSRAFDDTNEFTYRRLVDISWKIKRYLNIGTEAQLKKNIKLIDDFVYKTIRIKTQQMNKSKLQDDHEFSLKKEDILSRFMQMDNKDPKFLRDIILNFVLAGKDPIATTMSWFLYMLCKHPQVQDKVAKEIREAMKLDKQITCVADFEACVTEDALDKMQYLQAALAETIRLYPPVPLDVKICFSDDVLPDGCMIKKGDMISYMPYAMGRMKFIWGDDALEFKPERWLDDNGCFHSESPFKFTAFQIFRRSGISVKKEAPVNFLTDPKEGRSTLRPADILVFGWVRGKHACVDVTGVSPLVGLGNGVFTVGQAALKAASCKVKKHDKACLDNQHVFIPFAFDTFGFLAPEAVELLKRVQRVMHSNIVTPRSMDVVFKRISFIIQKGIAAQLVARLPSALM